MGQLSVVRCPWIGTQAIRRVAICALASATLLGCGKQGDKLTSVTGKVTVDGSPLTTGAVAFHPDSSKGNTTRHLPVGNMDGSGTYKLTTATKDGAPPGWYKVTVSAQQPIDPKNPYAPPKHLIHPKFSDPTTSGLEVAVVVSPAPAAYDLQLAQ